MKRCLLCLRELPIFHGLARGDFVKVCLSSAKRQVAKGQSLFLQGEPASSIYLIKAGKLKLTQLSGDGRESILDVVGPGEVLGETLLFQNYGRPYSAIALEDAKVCCFSRSQMEMLIQQEPHLAVDVISYLSQKLLATIEQAGEAAGIPVRERLLRLLMRLADKYGEQSADGILVPLELTQQDMADMIGASRVMVANVLRELRSQGTISRRGKYYLLAPDPCVTRHFSTRPAPTP